MVSKRVFIVFVLPAITSLVFGSVVMTDILQNPNRELSMLQMSLPKENSSHNTLIEIIGLSKQYSTSEPIEIQAKINDHSFDCGDLYVTIYSSEKNEYITQSGFFEQCFENENNVVPVGDKFSEVVNTPGTYELVVEMVSKKLTNISISEAFTVK